MKTENSGDEIRNNNSQVQRGYAWQTETPRKVKQPYRHFTCWHLSLRVITDPALVLPHKAY